MATPAEAVKEASRLTSQAIGVLAALGPEAPSSVREALSSLGTAFSVLGYVDPNLPFSIPREGDR